MCFQVYLWGAEEQAAYTGDTSAAVPQSRGQDTHPAGGTIAVYCSSVL